MRSEMSVRPRKFCLRKTRGWISRLPSLLGDVLYILEICQFSKAIFAIVLVDASTDDDRPRETIIDNTDDDQG